MFLRLPILFVVLLSLAFGPAKVNAGCFAQPSKAICGGCCAMPESPCCAAADKPEPSSVPASISALDQDLKLMASLRVEFTKFRPLHVGERMPASRFRAEQLPAPSRLEVSCIRLI